MIGTKVREMKFRTAYRIYALAWRLHAPRVEAPAGSLHFIRHPWVVSNEKLKAAIGWEPKYDSREVYDRPCGPRGCLKAARNPLLRCARRALSSVGRAPARQAGGHWFESSSAHHQKAPLARGFLIDGAYRRARGPRPARLSSPGVA